MRLLAALSLLVALSPCALAQTTQSELEAKLVHQPMFLRGLWSSDALKFDADGHLASASGTTSPLLSAIDADKLELKDGRIVLKGRRMALVYHGEQSGWDDPKERVKIEIAAPPSGDYTQVLTSVFTKELADLAPAAPDFWKDFLLHPFKPQLRRVDSAADRSASPPMARIGGGVKAPRVISAPEPEFSELARGLKASGRVMVSLQVDADGRPSHLRIVRPFGLGLDEKAIEAVNKYRFEPAMKDGAPVPVEMNVEVNFQHF